QHWYKNVFPPSATEFAMPISERLRLPQLKTSNHLTTRHNTVLQRDNVAHNFAQAELPLAYAWSPTSAVKRTSSAHRSSSNAIQLISNSLVLQVQTQRLAEVGLAETPRYSTSPIIPRKSFALTPYRSAESATRTLRESGYSAAQQAPLQQWRQQIEQRLQQIVQNKERGEQSVQTQVVHQITHNSETREQIKILMNESFLSTSMLHSLTERLANNLEKRHRVERYRKGVI
ncbi:MAG: hypothetical protein K2P84_05845, partial [Undibacterium sp.]|nr:hypothetical protein [Undibacterium sp.]